MEIVPQFYIGDLQVDAYPFSVIRGEGGLDLGAPENVMQVVDSMMVDGQPMTSTGTGNRTLVLPLLVEGADLLELAENEATLIQACEKVRNTFTLDPGDGYAPPTVFDTFRIQAVHTRDDRREAALVRRWDLTIPALPYGRSPKPVTQTLTPTSTAPSIVDNGSSLSTWSGGFAWNGQESLALTATTFNGESVIKADYVYSWDGQGTGGTTFHVTYTDAVPTTTYVAIDIAYEGTWSDGGYGLSRVNLIGGGGYAPFSTETVMYGTTPYMRYWFTNPGGSSLTFSFGSFYSGERIAYIASLVAAEAPGIAGIMAVDTVGSVRATGSVTCSRAAVDIEWLFIYADPQLGLFSPALPSTWRYGRDGTYVVYGKGYTVGQVASVSFTDSAGRVVYTEPTRIDAEVAAMEWQPLGLVALGGFESGLIGPQTVSGTAGDLRIFRLDDDTTLAYHDGLAANAVTLRAPDVNYPAGAVFADGVAINPEAPGFRIAVPATSLYVEANNSDTSPVTTTLDYFPRFHTYAAA